MRETDEQLGQVSGGVTWSNRRQGIINRRGKRLIKITVNFRTPFIQGGVGKESAKGAHKRKKERNRGGAQKLGELSAFKGSKGHFLRTWQRKIGAQVGK